MSFFVKAADVFRDFVTNGVPSSGKWEPKKSDLRAWGAWLEDIVSAFFSTGGKIYQTRSLLFADLVPGANSMAWVMEDPTVANNGIYRKIGVTGAGSWLRAGDLPFSFIVASNPGTGTPNAIQATTSVPVSSSALVMLPVAATNTSTPVTVSFNDGAALTVKTVSGHDVVDGGLTAGMVALGVVSGSMFRLITDQASSAILDLAQAAAESSLAAANAGFVFDSTKEFTEASIPGVLDFVRTAGYYVPGDGGAATYSRLVTAPSPVRPWHKQSADGAWWVISSNDGATGISVAKFGGVPDCTEQGTGTDLGPPLLVAWNFAISIIGDGAVVEVPPGRYRMATPIVLDGQGKQDVKLIIQGTITTDAVAMTAIAIRNMIGFRIKAAFLKGGRWASGAPNYGYYVNYSTTADVPGAGGQQAILIQGVFDYTVDLSSFGYAGRLLCVGSRVDPDHPQTGAIKGCLTSNRDHDFSKPSGAQSLWADTAVIGQGNWGHLDRITCDFDLWGPVWRNWNDIAVGEIDAGFHYTGPKFEGCVVCEFDNFYIGTISTNLTGSHVIIGPSAERDSSQFRANKMRFLDHGHGLYIKNATSVKIGRLDGGGVGALTMIDVDNSQVVHIDSASLNGGERALRVRGGNADQIYVGLNSRGTVTDNHVHIESSVGGLIVLNDLNLTEAATGKSLVKVDGSALVFINSPLLYSFGGNITDLVAGNKVHMRNGAVLGAAGLTKTAPCKTILGTVGNDGNYI